MFLSDFKQIWSFFDIPGSNFTKILPLGAELIHAEKWADGEPCLGS